MGEVATTAIDETTILEIKPSSTRIRIFLNPQLFLCGSRFRPRVSGEPQLLESALQSGNF